LMTQAIHTLDLFRALVGGVEQVAAVSVTTPLHRMETEDFVAATLLLAGGAPASLSATTAAYPGFSEQILLICEHASARLDAGRLAVHWHDGRVEEVADVPEGTVLGGGADPMDFPHDAHRELIAAFLDAVEAGRAPMVSGRDVLETHRLIDALLRSAR